MIDRIQIPFLILSLISVYLIISIGLDIEYLKVCCFGNADNINGILLNLSYSFFAAVIFYVLLEYLPNLKLRNKAYKELHYDLQDLNLKLYDLIGILNMMFFNNQGNGKSSDDYINSNYIKKQHYSFYYLRNDTKEHFLLDYDFKKISMNILSNIKQLKESYLYAYIDSDLILSINKLEKNEFLKSYSNHKSIFREIKHEYSNSNNHTNILDLVIILSTLQKHTKKTYNHTFEPLNIHDTNELKKFKLERKFLLNIEMKDDDYVFYFEKIKFNIVSNVLAEEIYDVHSLDELN